MKVSIIVPAHNEEENIVSLIEKIERAIDIEYEILVVNDHSTDSTAKLVSGLMGRYPFLRLINNPLEGGFANALKAGFVEAKGEAIVPVMGDLCDDLNTIKKMSNLINDGFDVVCGSRYINGGLRLGGSKVKGFFSRFVGWSLHYLLGVPTYDIANAFKMYRKKVIDGIIIEAKGFEISMEIPLKAYYAGFKITEVSTVWRERNKGKSNFKMLKLLPNYLKFYLWAIIKRFRK